jgi:L-threonylcarbamoyladenylate synthase
MKIINNKNKILSGSYIDHIAGCLKKGRIVILPTSTIYGVSCIYDRKDALEKVCRIKGREKNIPFIILISDILSLYELVEDINKTAENLIKKYWFSDSPASLTLLFKRNKKLKGFITADSDKIALRLDPLIIIKEIINITGPVISTSATVSGQKEVSPRTIFEIPVEIRKGVDLILDLERELPGIPSTILDVSGNKPVIIRQGSIEPDELKKLL